MRKLIRRDMYNGRVYYHKEGDKLVKPRYTYERDYDGDTQWRVRAFDVIINDTGNDWFDRVLMTPDHLTSFIKHHANTMLDDVKAVTIEFDMDRFEYHTYMWISKKSIHIKNDNFSQEFRSFIDKFCTKTQPELFSADRNYSLKGLEICAEKFIEVYRSDIANSLANARKMALKNKLI